MSLAKWVQCQSLTITLTLRLRRQCRSNSFVRQSEWKSEPSQVRRRIKWLEKIGNWLRLSGGGVVVRHVKDRGQQCVRFNLTCRRLVAEGRSGSGWERGEREREKKITTTKVSSDVGKVNLNYFRTQNQLEVCLEEVVPFPALRHVILRSLFRCFQFLFQSLVFHFISVAIVFWVSICKARHSTAHSSSRSAVVLSGLLCWFSAAHLRARSPLSIIVPSAQAVFVVILFFSCPPPPYCHQRHSETLTVQRWTTESCCYTLGSGLRKVEKTMKKKKKTPVRLSWSVFVSKGERDRELCKLKATRTIAQRHFTQWLCDDQFVA